MADVRSVHNTNKHTNQNKILKWYDALHRIQQTQELDQAINIAIAGLMIITTFTFAAQFVVNMPTVMYDATGNCTKAEFINETHSKSRAMQKVKLALKEACDEINDVNIGTQVYINNVSSKFDMFHLCERHEVYENPKILQTGSHTGRCSETYGNITKTKSRSFPVVLKNTKTGKTKTFYTLKDSCAIHSAIERLRCTW